MASLLKKMDQIIEKITCSNDSKSGIYSLCRKKIVGIISLFLLILLSSTTAGAQNDYYWYKGQQVFIEKVPGKKYVLLQNVSDTTTLKVQLNLPTASVTHFDEIHDLAGIIPHGIASQSQNMWATLENTPDTSLGSFTSVLYESPYYKTASGERGFTHLFYVKLKNAADILILEQLAIQNNVQLLGKNQFMPLWFALSCSKLSSGNSLQMANLFYETGYFAAAQPDWISTLSTQCTTNDPYFGNQWGLENTGQGVGTAGVDIKACGAWQYTKGSKDVIVAVIDEGIELDHPDLTNLHPLSYDAQTGNSPSILRNMGDHGTACAGIIGAVHNNIGVAGIAPDCPLMSISMYESATWQVANGINWAWQNGASVLSNSYGGGVSVPIIDDAISNALTLGRNGLGCVVVFGAGHSYANDPVHSVFYPANSNADVIAVGAISPCGERKNPNSCGGESWMSNYGPELDIMAPGVFIPTTDLTGQWGYSLTDYHLAFNGTSSACPHVAAVAALILSVNPNLTQKEVADIMEQTAQKVGGYTYSTTTGRPNGTWDNEMGYGLVNAEAAVVMAKNMCTTGADLYSKDWYDDFGLEPNSYTSEPYPDLPDHAHYTSDALWISEDIWVRKTDDNGTEDENPEHSESGNNLNYVYVKVRNKGCQPSNGTEKLELRWAKTSTGLGWPDSWNGTLLQGSDKKAGDLIGELTLPVIQPGKTHIAKLSWNPPNPNDYDFVPEKWHFCLLSRILSGDEPITENSDVWFYAANNNNIAWKNLTVVNNVVNLPPIGTPCTAELFEAIGTAVGVANPTTLEESYDLIFSIPFEEQNQAITDNAYIFLSLDTGLYQKWAQGGKQGSGFTELNPHSGILANVIGSTPLHDSLFGAHRKVFQVTGPKVEFKNIVLQAGENHTTSAVFLYPVSEVSDKTKFFYDVTQKKANNNNAVGGVRYQIKKPQCSAKFIGAGTDQHVNLGCQANLMATNQQQCAVYEWKDQFGNIVSREPSFSTTIIQNEKYVLKAISQEGCISNDTVAINATTQPCMYQPSVDCFSDVEVYPNPTSSNTLTVKLIGEEQARIIITLRHPIFGTIVKQVEATLTGGDNLIPVNITEVAKGFYSIRITCPESTQTSYTGLFNRQ